MTLEIDGHQHGQKRGSDAHRDALIRLSVPVERIHTQFTVGDALLLLLLDGVREVVGLDRLDALPCWADARAAVRAAISEAA